MGNSQDNKAKLTKQDVYKMEFNKLTDIFKDVEESKRKLVEGLVQDAAFLKSENFALRELLSKTGMIKMHPKYPDLQKTVPAAKQYLQNINSYSTVIRTLNAILSRNTVDEDDGFDQWMKEQSRD